MSEQRETSDREALTRNFSGLGIPVTDPEISRLQATLRSMISPSGERDDIPGEDSTAQFDELFGLQKDRHNPSPINVEKNCLVQEGSSTKDTLDRAADVQSQFGCFVEIFKTPFGNAENGLPIAVKDVFEFGAHRPTAGVPTRSNHIKLAQSPAIDRLVQAGTSIIGTTKLPPWCYLPMEYNPAVTSPENPLDKDLLVGGSSSGSAVAVACGLVPAALGTDTGGSVRIPAALTGLYGFKPSLGRISVAGVVPLGETQDTVGILTQETECLSRLFNVMKNDHVALTDQPLRIGRPTNGFDKSDDEIVQAADIIAAKLTQIEASITQCAALPLDELNQNAGLITGYEAARHHKQGFIDSPEDYVGTVRERLLIGLSIDEKIYDEQMGRRARLFDFVLRRVFADNDILMVPTLNRYAPTRASCPVDDPAAVSRMTLDLLSTNRWVNLLGLPSITIPVALPGKSIPASVQFVGKPYLDEELIGLASKLSR